MTDKQIIDKVNVKECEYYCNGKCERYEEFVEADYDNYSVKCICEEENVLGTYDICDYQQLSRKQQECEELKKELMKKDEVNTFFNTPIEGWSNDPCGICKLKQALAEIKEIAECCQTPANCKDYCQFYNECIDGGLPLILQKIRESEG